MQPHLAFIANYYKQKSIRFATEIWFSLAKAGLAFYKSLSCVTFNWSHRQGSNLRPADYKSAALPTELRGHIQALRTCYGNFVYCAGIYKNKKIRRFLWKWVCGQSKFKPTKVGNTLQLNAILLVLVDGFEPSTPCVSGRCSIPLNYTSIYWGFRNADCLSLWNGVFILVWP